MSESLSIAIIGAGRTGTPLLRDLLQYDYIQLVGVADRVTQSPGMQLAREHEIPCYTDPMDLVQAVGNVDILVEVSGDPALKPQIKQHYEETDNRHTLIMHDLIARLIISLCDKRDHLIPTQHPDDAGIGA